MTDKITVIKAKKRDDITNPFSLEPMLDMVDIGFMMDVRGAVPESFIKYVPGKKFDKKKYPELYKFYGTDILPLEDDLSKYIKAEEIESVWKLIIGILLIISVIISCFFCFLI